MPRQAKIRAVCRPVMESSPTTTTGAAEAPIGLDRPRVRIDVL
jgi:hypothetical protein